VEEGCAGRNRYTRTRTLVTWSAVRRQPHLYRTVSKTSEFATHLVWENQTFPEPRLATIVVERPIPIIAKLFGDPFPQDKFSSSLGKGDGRSAPSDQLLPFCR
jgi:hypothetical protein